MFRFIHKKRSGFSLVELMVTLVIVGMVLSLSGQILYQFTRFFNAAEVRWEIQSAVQLAGRKFETNVDSIVNAYEADILYDPIVEQGIIMNADGTFTWKGGQEKSYVIPKENTVDSSNFYTYIFSTPAYNSDGTYLGSYLFIRNYQASRSELFLDAEGFGDTPVEVTFSMGRTPCDEPQTAAQIEKQQKEGIHECSTAKHKYLPNTISVHFKSGRQDLTSYQVDTAYGLVNMEDGKKINYKGGLVFEEEWLGGENGNIAMAGPAGWNETEYREDAPQYNLNATAGTGFPGNYAMVDYKTSAGGTARVQINTITKVANVMRFISPIAFHQKSDIDEMSGTANMASCLTSYAYSDVSKDSSHVLGSLREFRDNVLRGTTVGDWIIYNYYNNWSPFFVEKLGFLKPVYKAVLKPVAYVCSLFSSP